MLRQSRWDVYRSSLRASLEIHRYRRRPPPSGGDAFRVGVIGLGRIARHHVWAYQQTGRAVLAAGADPVSWKQDSASRLYGFGQTFADYREMLREVPLDLVSICTPAAYHAEAVYAATEAGVRGILCEKPLCTSLAEADALIDACRRRQVLLTIGHQRRFSPQHRFARQILREGMLGPLRVLSGTWPRDTLRSGIHMADLMRFYVGEVASVTAQVEKGFDDPLDGDLDALLRAGRSYDRRGAILVRFASPSDAVGFFRVEDMPLIRSHCHFLGEGGEMEVWCNGGVRYRSVDAAHWRAPQLDLRPHWLEFRLEIQSLMAAVRGRGTLELTGEDGRKSLEIAQAVLRSAIEGRSISLPLRWARETA